MRNKKALEIGNMKLFPARGSCRAFTSDDVDNQPSQKGTDSLC